MLTRVDIYFKNGHRLKITCGTGERLTINPNDDRIDIILQDDETISMHTFDRGKIAGYTTVYMKETE